MKSSKELVDKCSRLLNLIQQEERDGKMAEYPVIIFFFGQTAFSHFSDVKNVLDANLANGSYLTYLHVYEEADNCVIDNVLTKIRYRDIQTAVTAASIEALGTEDKIFSKKTHVFFECLLSTEEEKTSVYFEQYLEIKSTHNYEAVKTLYLMIDQIERMNEARAQAIIDRIARQEENPGTVYLLSNMLNSGALLREDRIWMNYRLVADIILLGNSRNRAADSKGGIKNSYSEIIHGGVKTVAYVYMGKQIEEITRITLHCLMNQLYDKEWKECNKPGEGEELQKIFAAKLSIETDGMELLKKIFREEIEIHMPDREELEFLPWKNYKAYRSFRRSRKGKEQQKHELDQASYGVLDAYLRLNYEMRMQKIMDAAFVQRMKDQLRDLACQKFSYMEILYYFKKIRWQDLEQSIRVKADSRRDEPGKIAGRAIFELAESFGAQAREWLMKEFERLFLHADNVKEKYEAVRDGVLRNQIGEVQIGEEMKQYYAEEVQNFLDKNTVSSPFSPKASIEEVLENIAAIFEQLIKTQSVYREPFEKEMELRLEKKSAQDQRDILKKQVMDNVRGQGRLQQPYDYMEVSDGKFCMIHEKSIFKGCLGLEEPSNEKIVFDLNRKDCLEMIEIYTLDRPERIKLRF